MMKKFHSSQRGFALVIALSLMAFVLLLILSISTLVQVESQSASVGLQQMRARLNAQLGAMIGLGDLQRYTGPDQRVTARADILLDPEKDETDVFAAGQSRWTGVWSSKETINDSFDQEDGLAVNALGDRPARWLISGNETNGLTIEPETSLSGDITTNLATIGGSVINKSSMNQVDTVKVPKVEILGDNNVAKGHYAYWVSDEGVKARVNLADPFLNSADPQAEYYRTAMAQVADPTAVTNSENKQPLADDLSLWKNSSEAPSKISSLKNIPIYTEDDLPSDEFFHDFTVHSSGVLANTKDGGLKRDLSTALLSLPTDMSSGGANSPMFPPANPSSGPGQMDPGGPKWEQLSSYYKLALANSIEKYNADSDEDSTINLRIPTNEQVGFTPVITRSNFFVQGFAERNPVREASGNWCGNLDPSTLPGSDAADWVDQNHDWYRARGYRYSLGMFPLVTLWNPYNRDMILGDLGLEFELPRIDIVSSGGSTETVASTGILTSKYNRNPEVKRQTVKFVIRGITLEAGEAVNFSPPCNSYYNASNPSDNILEARGSNGYVNGFFTEPVASTSDVVFWDNSAQARTNYEDWSKSKLSLNFTSGGSLWKQLVMLYSSPDIGVNSQFKSENRFKVITTRGVGNFDGGNRQSRVILINRLIGVGVEGHYNQNIVIAGEKFTNANGDTVTNVESNPNYYNPFFFGLPGLPPDNDLEAFSYNGADGPGAVGYSYFGDFIGGTGDTNQNIHLGSVDIIDANELSNSALGAKILWGARGAMKFPSVNYFRTEADIHLFLNMNPTAPVIHKEPNKTWDKSNNAWLESSVYTPGPIADGWNSKDILEHYSENFAPGTDFRSSPVGLSNTQAKGSSKMILFEVPNDIPLSVGQLAQANLMNFDVFSAGSTSPAIGNCIAGNGSKWNSHTLQTYATPMYAIGNSVANPLLPLARTEQWFSSVRSPWVNVPAAHYDYSYKLNDALWDEYFFSGITNEAPEFPLPNSRLRASTPSVANSDLVIENLAAANLLLDGAFNINSTSVAAWEAVLGAMREIETSGHPLDLTLRHNFARFNEPVLGTATMGESVPQLSNKDQLAAGYRNLTDAQIARLASEIVDEIRLRKNSVTGRGYPFLSLSEFINRSPQSTTPAFAWRGALQAAIDRANLNGLESGSTGLWAESKQYPLYYEPSGTTPIIDRPKADGMPGSFIQSDLLSKIGAFIQARSDTFTIRSYGAAQEQFGLNEGSSAYYEIVVQRTPSYVDRGDSDYEDPTIAVNQKFGRKYEIKSQRWVAKNEI